MDFNFVGPAYQAPSRYQDTQELINWFCEVDSSKQDAAYVGPLGRQDVRGVVAIYPTPGYTLAYTLPTGPVRALLTVPGGATHLAVGGNTLYSITAAYGVTSLGTLNTSSGPVSMDQNGVAAYICDGTNRYYYLYGAASLVTLGPTDGPFLGGRGVNIVDGTFIYNQPGTQNWAQSNLVGGAVDINGVTTPALALGKKAGAGDNLQTQIVVNRNVFLLGENTSEVWVNTGAGTFFGFSIIPGSNTQHGCAAPASVSRLGESFAMVSQDLRGQGIVVHAQGYDFVRMSTHAVENDIKDGVISDAIAWTYQVEGHEFYVLNFPTQDKTWVYDLATNYWHKWLSVDAYNVFHRHRGNCACVFQGKNLIGDYQNGNVYILSNQVYTENGNVIRRVRRAPHLTQDLQRVFYEELQIQFEPGVGLSTGQGQNPQAMLRWSNDGGSTWSNEHWTSIGVIGAYKNRAIWRRLGVARDRVFEVVVTDPVKAVIVSANLKASPGES